MGYNVAAIEKFLQKQTAKTLLFNALHIKNSIFIQEKYFYCNRFNAFFLCNL